MYEESFESIKGRMITNLDTDLDTREGTFVNDMYSPISVEFAKAYMNMDSMHSIMFVATSYGRDLDNKANEFGVFRKLGERAKGKIRFVGINGTLIPRNIEIFTDGGYKYLTISQAYIENGYIEIDVEADLVGSMYNIDSNTKWQLPVDVTVNELVNDAPFLGGIDVENDEEFRIRFFDNVRSQRTSGNSNDYEFWSKEINGVLNANVYPLWNGNGTVKVVVSGEKRKPISEDILNNVKAYISEKHPIGATVTVVTTTLFNVDIVATIQIEDSYNSEAIKSIVDVSVRDYIDKCISNIYRNKLGAKILAIEGVIDYSILTINGKTDSVIPIPSDSACNINSLNITVVGGIKNE